MQGLGAITHTSRAWFLSLNSLLLAQSSAIDLLLSHRQRSCSSTAEKCAHGTQSDDRGHSREMARLMPDDVATEIPAIRTQCHRNQSRNEKKVFFLDTTAIDR